MHDTILIAKKITKTDIISSMGLQGRSPCNPMDEMMSTQTIDFCSSVGYTPRCQQNAARGFGVVVTCNFPKVEITGSTPVTRSLNDLYHNDRGHLISPRLLTRGNWRDNWCRKRVSFAQLHLHAIHITCDRSQSNETGQPCKKQKCWSRSGERKTK